MYHLHSRLDTVKGIGEVLFTKLKEKDLHTVSDFLLNLPLRYEDFSNITTIAELKNLEPNSPFTIKAKVLSSSQFYKNRKNILSANIADETGKIKCTWFNNRFLAPQLKKAEQEDIEFFFSGKTSNQNSLTQPRTEKAPALEKTPHTKYPIPNTPYLLPETIHTGRLVPVYTSTIDIQQGKLRRLLKEILDNLEIKEDILHSIPHTKYPILNTDTDTDTKYSILPLSDALYQAHFPDNEEKIIEARERFALEEIIDLIQRSKKIKKQWQKNNSAHKIKIPHTPHQIPHTIPFKLTSAQEKSTQEILSDLQKPTSMNRLLIGDVGSGKTVVAGIACHHVLKNGHNVALIAPTQILAEQHTQSIKKIFPNFNIEIITAKTSKKFKKKEKKNTDILTYSHTTYCAKPTLYIGTHALINQLENIHPALIIYDEQHRFGVEHRSPTLTSKKTPHILTMTATPIPRSLMLTIFSHLQLSVIDELPAGRLPIKTWLVPEKKRVEGFTWISKELLKQKKESPKSQTTNYNSLAIVVCPFIDPSHHQAFENIASATETYENVKSLINKTSNNKLTTALLHGRLSQKKKDAVIKQLFDKKINVLVTTPIVEVGLDLPNANIIVIEAAQRFGLASLHQLRGRVGRAGQKSYCLLFSSAKNSLPNKRLSLFTKETNGMKLAEFDLKNRGAGSIFGTSQSGFSNLKFASWTNLDLISQAQKIATTIEKEKIQWQPLWKNIQSKSKTTNSHTPILAN